MTEPRTPVIRPDGRPDPPEAAPERDVLGGVLDFLRGTVVMKPRGLTDEQARTAACPPSGLTVAGTAATSTCCARRWTGRRGSEPARGDGGWAGPAGGYPSS